MNGWKRRGIYGGVVDQAQVLVPQEEIVLRPPPSETRPPLLAGQRSITDSIPGPPLPYRTQTMIPPKHQPCCFTNLCPPRKPTGRARANFVHVSRNERAVWDVRGRTRRRVSFTESTARARTTRRSSLANPFPRPRCNLKCGPSKLTRTGPNRTTHQTSIPPINNCYVLLISPRLRRLEQSLFAIYNLNSI